VHISQRLRVELDAGMQLKWNNRTFQVLPRAAPRNSANVMDKYLLMELAKKDAN
jgi:hypothetical protein